MEILVHGDTELSPEGAATRYHEILRQIAATMGTRFVCDLNSHIGRMLEKYRGLVWSQEKWLRHMKRIVQRMQEANAKRTHCYFDAQLTWLHNKERELRHREEGGAADGVRAGAVGVVVRVVLDDRAVVVVVVEGVVAVRAAVRRARVARAVVGVARVVRHLFAIFS